MRQLILRLNSLRKTRKKKTADNSSRFILFSLRFYSAMALMTCFRLQGPSRLLVFFRN